MKQRTEYLGKKFVEFYLNSTTDPRLKGKYILDILHVKFKWNDEKGRYDVHETRYVADDDWLDERGIKPCPFKITRKLIADILNKQVDFEKLTLKEVLVR